VNFIEPFYIEASTGCFVGGHAGPNDHTEPAAAGRVKIARDVRFAKSGYRYAGAPFAWYRFAPGLKTMAHFSEESGRYKLVCTLVEVLDGEHFITGYSHGVFRPHVPVERLFERIAEIGTTQHFAIVDGDFREGLQSLARVADLDFHLLE
jgi:L-arabinose isomerase